MVVFTEGYEAAVTRRRNEAFREHYYTRDGKLGIDCTLKKNAWVWSMFTVFYLVIPKMSELKWISNYIIVILEVIKCRHMMSSV